MITDEQIKWLVPVYQEVNIILSKIPDFDSVYKCHITDSKSWGEGVPSRHDYFYDEDEGLGFININAHIMCSSNPSAYYKDNIFSYCCFGDPSIKVWTDSIKHFPEPIIEVTSDSLNISVGDITDYDIIVASESDRLIARYNTVYSNLTIPLPTVSCTIAIHKSNYESYLFDYIATNYIQNTTIKRRTFASSSPIAIGKNVTTEIPAGDVAIERGGLLQLKQNSDVTIPNGFECKLGGQLKIN